MDPPPLRPAMDPPPLRPAMDPPPLPTDVVFVMLKLEPSLIVTAMSVCREWRDVVRTLCRIHNVPSPALLQRMLTNTPLFARSPHGSDDELQRLLAAGRHDVLEWLVPQLFPAKGPAWLHIQDWWMTRSDDAEHYLYNQVGRNDEDGRKVEHARGRVEMVHFLRTRVAECLLQHDMVVVAKAMLHNDACWHWLCPRLCGATSPAMQAVVLDSVLALPQAPSPIQFWGADEEALVAAAQAGHVLLLQALFDRRLCDGATISTQHYRVMTAAARNVDVMRLVLDHTYNEDDLDATWLLRLTALRSDADPRVWQLVHARGLDTDKLQCHLVTLVKDSNQHLFEETCRNLETWDAAADAVLAWNRDAFVERFNICAAYTDDANLDYWDTVQLGKKHIDHREAYVDHDNNVVLVATLQQSQPPPEAELDGFHVVPPMCATDAVTMVRVIRRGTWPTRLPPASSTLTYHQMRSDAGKNAVQSLMRAFNGYARCRRCLWFWRLAHGEPLRVVKVVDDGVLIAYILADVAHGPHELTVVFAYQPLSLTRTTEFMKLVRMLVHDISALHTANGAAPHLLLPPGSVELQHLLWGCGWRKQPCTRPGTLAMTGPCVHDPLRANALRRALMVGPVTPLPMVQSMAALSVAAWERIRARDLNGLKALLLAQLADARPEAQDEAAHLRSLEQFYHLTSEDLRVYEYW